MASNLTSLRARTIGLLAWSILALTIPTAAVWALNGPWFALLVMVVLLAAFTDAAIAAWVNMRVPMLSGPEAIIGRSGKVFDTKRAAHAAWCGRVRIGAEIWNAYAERDSFAPGDAVRVVAVEGLRLRVTGNDV